MITEHVLERAISWLSHALRSRYTPLRISANLSNRQSYRALTLDNQQLSCVLALAKSITGLKP